MRIQWKRSDYFCELICCDVNECANWFVLVADALVKVSCFNERLCCKALSG